MKMFLGIMALILFTIVFVMQAPPGIQDTDQQVITILDLESYIGATKLKAINKLTLKDSFDIDAPATQYLQPSLREKVNDDSMANNPDDIIYFKDRSIRPVFKRTGIGLTNEVNNDSTDKHCGYRGLRPDVSERSGIGLI